MHLAEIPANLVSGPHCAESTCCRMPKSQTQVASRSHATFSSPYLAEIFGVVGVLECLPYKQNHPSPSPGKAANIVSMYAPNSGVVAQSGGSEASLLEVFHQIVKPHYNILMHRQAQILGAQVDVFAKVTSNTFPYYSCIPGAKH